MSSDVFVMGIGPYLAPRPSLRAERVEATPPPQYADPEKYVACPTCCGHGFLVLFDARFPDDPPTKPYCCSCMGDGFIDTELHQQRRPRRDLKLGDSTG